MPPEISRSVSVAEALGYTPSVGLVVADDNSTDAAKRYAWSPLRERFGIDAAYLVGESPFVCFKDAVDTNEILQLHRRLWNYNRAPLLIASTPGRVYVLNCFAPPSSSAGPRSLVDYPAVLASAALSSTRVTDGLASYSRTEVDTGHAWRQVSFGDPLRAGRSLVSSLRDLKNRLGPELPQSVINRLVTRSLFIRYLEDRGHISGSRSEQSEYVGQLRTSVVATQAYFERLADRFNGDLFRIADDEAVVTEKALLLLADFLSGVTVGSGQLPFWEYDFNAIPVELVSAVYEELLLPSQRRLAAYYTPLEVVDFIWSRTFPWDDHDMTRILDPACGSGVFLVEAFRRLAARRANEMGRPLESSQLRDLLLRSIVGIDTDEDALRVAAFSCSLAMVDMLSSRELGRESKLPKLFDVNLFHRDFFDHREETGSYYDVVVGNPPWIDKMTPAAKRWVVAAGVKIPGQQIALAFLEKSISHLKVGGRLGMALPAKALLHNRRPSAVAFRRRLFDKVNVDAIADLSTYRDSLFAHSTAPLAVLFSVNRPSRPDDILTHIGPRNGSIDPKGVLVLNGDEVKGLDRRDLSNQRDMWKTALWGSKKDLAFVSALVHTFPSLTDIVARRGWIVGHGMQAHRGDAFAVPENLIGLPFIEADQVSSFTVDVGSARPFAQREVHRVRDPHLYFGPRLVIKKGATSDGRIHVGYLDRPSVVTHALIVIASGKSETRKSEDDRRTMLAMSAVMNSSFARYYHFMTASAWGVDRGEIQQQDQVLLPMPTYDLAGQVELVRLAEEAVGNGVSAHLLSAIDEAVIAAFDLRPSERQLIEDSQLTAIDLYLQGPASKSLLPPSRTQMGRYADACLRGLDGLLANRSGRFVAEVHIGSAAYQIVSFTFASGQADDGVRTRLVEDLASSVARHAPLIAGRSIGLPVRPYVAIVEADTVHIVKPAEVRYWTPTAGRGDSDEIVGLLARDHLTVAVGT